MKFVKTKIWKVFMSRLYGWGASVVILGALFKIMHWPGADMMLIIGMGVEVVVFFFSAFEPLHEEPDWSLVYPELAGLEPSAAASPGRTISVASHSVTVSSTLDKLLEDANIGPDLINKLSSGLHNLSNNVSKMADISNAAVATTAFIHNVENASKSVLELSQSYKNTSEFLKHDLSLAKEYTSSLKNATSTVNQFSETLALTANAAKENLDINTQFNQNMRTVATSSHHLAENYRKHSDVLAQVVDALESSSSKSQQYSDQLQRSANNLMALNVAYELQTMAANNHAASTEKLHGTMHSLVGSLHESLDSSQNYKHEMEKLNNNIRALNSIYGNMLSAMNFNVGR